MKTNSKKEEIIAWLTNLASRWEHQPDCDEIHMSFPNKKVSRISKTFGFYGRRSFFYIRCQCVSTRPSKYEQVRQLH